MDDILELAFDVMGKIAEFMFELFFDVIADKILKRLALKNVAMPVRIIIWLLLLLIFVGVIII